MADRFISALALLGFSIPVFWLKLLPRTAPFARTLKAAAPGDLNLFYGEVKPVTGFAIIDAPDFRFAVA